MARTRIRLAASAAAAALVTGLVTHGTAAGAASGRPVTHVVISSSRHITMPTHLRPGRAEFAVSGSASQLVQLFRSDDPARYGRARLAADLGHGSLDGDHFRSLESHFVLAGGGFAGNAFWAELSPGKYYLVDPSGATPPPSKIHVIDVAGSARDATLPLSRPTISAIHARDWSPTPSSIPHTGSIHFVNASSDTHVLVLWRMWGGKTDADITKALRGTERFDKVFDLSSPQLESGVLSPGRQMTFTYSMKAGTYAMMCLWPDHANGQPDVLMGMHRAITLT